MKNYVVKNRISLLFLLSFVVFVTVSYLADFRAGKAIFGGYVLGFVKETMLFLPFMFILIGLADVWIGKESVEKHAGESSGVKGILFMFLLANFQGGSLYAALPVACLMREKGAGTRNIFLYLGFFCTMKIPMLMFETGFLGWKFTLLRTAVTLPVIILIAVIMEKYIRSRKDDNPWIRKP